jgi:poly(ADP-ribose) glycohydrolase ARH3
VDEMLDARMGKGTYTDDTQMMIATTKSLIELDGLDPAHMAKSYLEHYDSRRGYGQGTTMVFNKWRKGQDVDRAGEEIFDGGSFGNGGSMRIAPVGVYYHDDLDALEEAVRTVCGLTHAHPLGIGSSFLQAYSVARAFHADPEKQLSGVEWVSDLRDRLPSNLDEKGILRENLDTILGYLDARDKPVAESRVAEDPGCTSKAFESVPTSIYAFLSHSESFADALVYAVGIGGDTDTVGAMAGAIAGAYHGIRTIPEQWWNSLENGEDGRDDILELSLELVQPKSQK